MCWGTKDAPRIAAVLAGGIGAFSACALRLPAEFCGGVSRKSGGRWRSGRAVPAEKDLPVKTKNPHSAPQPPFHRIIASGGKALCVFGSAVLARWGLLRLTPPPNTPR